MEIAFVLFGRDEGAKSLIQGADDARNLFNERHRVLSFVPCTRYGAGFATTEAWKICINANTYTRFTTIYDATYGKVNTRADFGRVCIFVRIAIKANGVKYGELLNDR